MILSDISTLIPSSLLEVLQKQGLTELRPCQEKAINAGLLDGKNLVVCTPTASGKTLVAELAALKNILERKGKAIYLVPLKALATEKYNQFVKRYGHLISIGISIGDYDESDSSLGDKDLIVATAEKMDSMLRHRTSWVREIKALLVDEAHLINDANRGPTLEIIITMLRHLVPDMQIVCLSATIGNPDQFAGWLDASLVVDTWRPVQLKQGVCVGGKIKFHK